MRGKVAKALRKLALKEAQGSSFLARIIYKKFKKNWNWLKRGTLKFK